MKGTEITEVKVDALFEKIAGLIEESRKKVSSAINIEKVNSLNEHLKTIASSNDYVHFIDIREKLSTNGVLKSHLLYDNGRLNFLGSNMIYEKINESLSIINPLALLSKKEVIIVLPAAFPIFRIART